MTTSESNEDGRTRVGAVVVAAGVGTRMNGVDKVLAPLGEQPLIWHVLRRLNACELVDVISLVMSPSNVEDGRRLVIESKWPKVAGVVEGGSRRQDSVLKGLELLQDTRWTIVHDGARPFVEVGMIARGLVQAQQTGAAVAAVPVTDTIKSVDDRMEVSETLDRARLWSVQTPQVFDTELLLRAHSEVSDDVTDDASMVEAIGNPVRVFMGSYENLKITTPEDLVLAESIYETQQKKLSEALG